MLQAAVRRSRGLGSGAAGTTRRERAGGRGRAGAGGRARAGALRESTGLIPNRRPKEKRGGIGSPLTQEEIP
jgi:hypothetical protein